MSMTDKMIGHYTNPDGSISDEIGTLPSNKECQMPEPHKIDWTLVDTVTPLARLVRSGVLSENEQVIALDSIRQARMYSPKADLVFQSLEEAYQEYGDQSRVNYIEELREVDYSPGMGNIALWSELVSRKEESDWLRRFRAGINYPQSYMIEELTPDSVPLVIKDTFDNRGANKLLVKKVEELDVAARSLYGVAMANRDRIAFEEFIESAGGHSSSFRVVATPTGSILGAQFKTNLRPYGEVSRDQRLLTSEVFQRAGEYVPAYSFMSNSARGGINVNLKIDPSQELAPIDGRVDRKVLSSNEIDPETRMLPDDVSLAAGRAALLLGGSYGVLLGIDIVRDQSGNLHLMEVNGQPDIEGSAIAGLGENPEELDVYRLAVRRIFDDAQGLHN